MEKRETNIDRYVIDRFLEMITGGIYKSDIQEQIRENMRTVPEANTHQESVRQKNVNQENLPKDDSPGTLFEILKELKEMNSNLKALVVRADTNKEETRKLREKIEELIEKMK